MESNKRFLISIVFAIIGIIATIILTNYLSGGIAQVRDGYDLIPVVAGAIQSDVRSFLFIIFPVQYGVFFVLTLPIALLMIFFNKLSRTATYELGIYSAGTGFNAVRMIRRAVVPALFALSFGEIFLNLMPDLIFSIPEIAPATGGTFLQLFNPLQAIIGALIALVVGIVIFAPTWVLNDSGIISQVNQNQMDTRRCPDTEGIGRWFSNLFGGFAILTYPITMLYRFIFRPLIVLGGYLDPFHLINGIIWIVIIPLLIMAFVMPFIILNELSLGRTRPRIQSFARKLGAKNAKPKSLMLEMLEAKDHLNDQPDDSDVDSSSSRLTRM